MKPGYPETTISRGVHVYSPVVQLETQRPETRRLVHANRGGRVCNSVQGWTRRVEVGPGPSPPFQEKHAFRKTKALTHTHTHTHTHTRTLTPSLEALLSDLAPKLSFLDLKDPKVIRLSKQRHRI